jgi:hypothetical protein
MPPLSEIIFCSFRGIVNENTALSLTEITAFSVTVTTCSRHTTPSPYDGKNFTESLLCNKIPSIFWKSHVKNKLTG